MNTCCSKYQFIEKSLYSGSHEKKVFGQLSRTKHVFFTAPKSRKKVRMQSRTINFINVTNYLQPKEKNIILPGSKSVQE